MLTTKLTLGLLAASLFAGCTTDPADPGSNPPGDDDVQVPLTSGVSTVAGTAHSGYVDGSRDDARFSNPVNVAFRNGKLYVADFDNGKLRVIDTTTYETSTVISQQGFQRPFGLAFAADGTLYVSTDNDPAGKHDDMSGTIWKVDVNARTAQVIAAAIGRPRGLAVLPDGRLATADRLHHVVQIVDPASGAIETIAGEWNAAGMVDGDGVSARFSAPYSVAVRTDGKLVITDFDNNRIRVVGLDGQTSTLAGGVAGFVDGAMTAAKFNHPQAIALAANGDMYVTDLDNFRVRRIVGTNVETIAGNGSPGYLDADDRLSAQLYGIEGLSVVPDGSMIYVADGNRGEQTEFNRIRQIKL